ncbi:Alcohol dehydrogenase GroES-like domain protein [Acididesulfobacillus acetoxydans]|uniref:Alcohol dehydrogenase GroES-like domain protein n=1 Tax=Acididesulfobacillus acetoxydans TaxID=1561005 RepID=A0A8S0VWG3_9FIRM|nr:galactitol-1-phosphate 5-dehydrogenase [Acididesulfobacillus acetoxydans]CAA7600843.1 Alcohol dehydrogenase GroES-like domain protein [Acididesulfobacillus acetoxydans]CEJ09294.1 Galactitol-1-phosphate 5-dehydrogenase [Acididesulfobacillus acetoxydans]
MKAVRLYKAGDLRVEDVELTPLKPLEVLVKTKYVGVCGSDIPRVLREGAHKAPLTIGHEFSGEVVDIGSDVVGWQKGARVTAPPLIPCNTCTWCQEGEYSLCSEYNYLGSRTDGAMAEFVKVPVTNLLLLPDKVSFRQGALTDPAANAMHAIIRGCGITSNDSVAVFGLGSIGLFAVQIAKILGSDTIAAIDIESSKVELAKKLGANIGINSSLDDPIETLNSLTNGRGMSLVLDMSGSPIAQNQAVLAAAKRGRVVYVGISHSKLELSDASVDRLLRYEITISGSWNSFSAPFPGREWTDALGYMERGLLLADPIVSYEFSLDQAPSVFDQIRDKSITFNKILFTPEARVL